MQKTCNGCGQDKLAIDFYSKLRLSKYPGSNAGLSHNCKECDKKARKAYVADNKAKLKATDRKYHLSKYGLTPQDYDNMLMGQKGCCQGCDKHHTEFNRNLVVDHCHATGKVRGLLCVGCNLILGYAEDKQKVLLNLITYLDNSELADVKTNVVNLNSLRK